jgi:putative DNA primase/helicase
MSMTPKPTALAVQPEHIPVDLLDYTQFVGWQHQWDTDREAWAKRPINPATGRLASPTDPATWASFEAALDAYRRRQLDGIGFVFTADDPFTGVDLDKCRDPNTGELAPWAADIVLRLDSYAEISPSGLGVKILVRGKLPGPGNRRGPIEMYDQARYFTLTGHRFVIGVQA